MRTSRASLRNAASIARSNSGAGTTTCSLTLFATPAGLSSGARRFLVTLDGLDGALHKEEAVYRRRASTPVLMSRVARSCASHAGRLARSVSRVARLRSHPVGSAAAPSTHHRVTVDQGITHVALPVSDLSASLEFYARYARMQVVHRRTDADSGTSVAWISDLTRPFVLVLIEVPALANESGLQGDRLGGIYCHVGWGSRAATRSTSSASSPAPRRAPCSDRWIRDRPSATGRTSSIPTVTTSKSRSGKRSG